MKIIIKFILFAALILSAETLFEVKDASNNKVLDVSTDGLRIMNMGDTVMVISSNEIKANISSSKGLSRSFCISTASSKGSGIDLMKLTSDSTRFWISDTGSGFGVASQTAPHGKSIGTNFLKVSNVNTVMREGTAGDIYTDFSPENIFIGLNSGQNTVPLNATSGENNVFVGNLSGFTNSTGASNVFMGYKSGYSNFSGYNNCFMGQESGYSNYSGRMNVFIGNKAGYNNYDGDFNVFIGYNAGVQNTSGDRNIFIGYESGILNSTGWGNTFVGEASGTANTEGYANSYFGRNSGFSNSTGDYNTVMGYEASTANQSGNYNSIFGAESGKWNYLSGSSNSLFGYRAGYGAAVASNTFSNNSYFGSQSGYSTTTGSNNTNLGYQSGYSNATGTGNVFLGYQAGYNETGSQKLYIDNSNTANPLIYGDFDSDWIKINGDMDVLYNLTTAALDVNGDADVSGAFGSGTTTMDGTFFRLLSDPGSGTTPTNYVYQGGLVNSSSKAFAFTIYDALWVTSHAFFDGNITAPLVYSSAVGATYTDLYIDNTGKIGYLSSSKRYKDNIKDMNNISWLYRLRPVTYSYKTDNSRTEYGLIAEEVEEENKELVSYNSEGTVETVNYNKLIAPMLKAIQDQQKMIEELRKEIEELKAR
jgi:hypothetical protein